MYPLFFTPEIIYAHAHAWIPAQKVAEFTDLIMDLIDSEGKGVFFTMLKIKWIPIGIPSSSEQLYQELIEILDSPQQILRALSLLNDFERGRLFSLMWLRGMAISRFKRVDSNDIHYARSQYNIGVLYESWIPDEDGKIHYEREFELAQHYLQLIPETSDLYSNAQFILWKIALEEYKNTQAAKTHFNRVNEGSRCYLNAQNYLDLCD